MHSVTRDQIICQAVMLVKLSLGRLLLFIAFQQFWTGINKLVQNLLFLSVLTAKLMKCTVSGKLNMC